MARKLKHEVVGKTPAVALHGLIKSGGWHSIEGRQVPIQNHFLAPNRQDHFLYAGKDGTLVQKQLFPWLTRRRGGIGAAEKEVYGNSENNHN